MPIDIFLCLAENSLKFFFILPIEGVQNSKGYPSLDYQLWKTECDYALFFMLLNHGEYCLSGMVWLPKSLTSSQCILIEISGTV